MVVRSNPSSLTRDRGTIFSKYCTAYRPLYPQRDLTSSVAQVVGRKLSGAWRDGWRRRAASNVNLVAATNIHGLIIYLAASTFIFGALFLANHTDDQRQKGGKRGARRSLVSNSQSRTRSHPGESTKFINVARVRTMKASLGRTWLRHREFLRIGGEVISWQENVEIEPKCCVSGAARSISSVTYTVASTGPSSLLSTSSTGF